MRPEEGAGVADWADASAAGIPALPTAAGATAESTAWALADEFVESSAANKNGGTSNATAAMVAIIRVLNFIVVLLNCCSRKSSILTIRLGLPSTGRNAGTDSLFPAIKPCSPCLCIYFLHYLTVRRPSRGTVSAWPY